MRATFSYELIYYDDGFRLAKRREIRGVKVPGEWRFGFFPKIVTNKSPGGNKRVFRFRLIRFTTPSLHNVDRFAAELNALRECKLVFFKFFLSTSSVNKNGATTAVESAAA